MVRRTPGLLLHLAATAAAARAARRAIASEIARGGAGPGRMAERLGQPGLRRPEGPLVWINASDPVQLDVLSDLAGRIEEAEPRASVLLTSAALPAPVELPSRTLHQMVPIDAGSSVAAFLDHWQPDAVLWAGTLLRPTLIDAVHRRGVPMALIDASGAPSRRRGWRRWTRLDRSALSRFDLVLATSEAAATALVAAGAPRAATEVAGALEEDAPALPCNIHERDAIAAQLQARPVWLAAAVPEEEEDIVLAAHRSAARLAHRLLLILGPADPARGPALAARLAGEGMVVALRSAEGEPDPATEVFIADADGELGLWYRLAPVAFLGGTLTRERPSRSPLEPAALGSAILHGPEVGGHAATYARFAAAGAARSVAGAEGLGSALSDLLSPDRAAAMAHAAWRVSTGGADAVERILAFLRTALPAAEAPALAAPLQVERA